MRGRATRVVIGLALAACGGDDGALPVDGAVIDVAVIDAAVIDAAVIDASMIDGAVIDAAMIDGAPIDAAMIDSAALDAPTCADDCPALGQVECVDDSSQRTCGNFDGDPCLEWSASSTCGATEACFAGTGCAAGFVLRLTVTGAGEVGLAPGTPCTGSCARSYAPATSVVLTPQPELAAHFAGWSGGGCSGTSPCTITAAATIAAPFAADCTSTTIETTTAGSPAMVAVDATHVYWTSFYGNAVKRWPKAGGAVETLATGSRPLGIVVDATYVYWTELVGDIVRRRLKSGGTVETIATGQDGAGSLADDATHLYWTNRSAGTLVRWPKAGGAVQVLVTGIPFPSTIPVRTLAVDATDVYWTNHIPGTVSKVAKAGGTPVVLVSGMSGPIGIALSASDVYWTNVDNGTIGRVAKSGGTPVVVGTTGAQPLGLALSGGYLYWVNSGFQQRVERMPVTGGVATALVARESGGWDVVVDDEAVYYTANLATSDSVKRLTRDGFCAPP